MILFIADDARVSAHVEVLIRAPEQMTLPRMAARGYRARFERRVRTVAADQASPPPTTQGFVPTLSRADSWPRRRTRPRARCV